MKVCVTGGAGYIGSHLVSRLLKLGHDVIVVDNLSNSSNVNPNTLFYECDIRNINSIEKELQKTDVFFHLAANKQATSEDNQNMISVNVGGTISVLDVAKKVGAKNFVLSSSAAVYPENAYSRNSDKKIREHDVGTPQSSPFAVPQNIYGVSKLMSEQLCEFMANKNFSVSVLRYFNVWGGEYNKQNKVKSAMEIFRNKKEEGLPVSIYGDGCSLRDYVHVEDVVSANILAMESNFKNVKYHKVFNICTGKGTNILDVVKKECGSDYPIKFYPRRDNELENSVGCPDYAGTILLNWNPKIFYK